MNRLEQSNMIQTIVKGYMADIDNPKTLAEIQDILINHFYTMANSPSSISSTYFEEEYEIWKNKPYSIDCSKHQAKPGDEDSFSNLGL